MCFIQQVTIFGKEIKLSVYVLKMIETQVDILIYWFGVGQWTLMQKFFWWYWKSLLVRAKFLRLWCIILVADILYCLGCIELISKKWCVSMKKIVSLSILVIVNQTIFLFGKLISYTFSNIGLSFQFYEREDYLCTNRYLEINFPQRSQIFQNYTV